MFIQAKHEISSFVAVTSPEAQERELAVVEEDHALIRMLETSSEPTPDDDVPVGSELLVEFFLHHTCHFLGLLKREEISENRIFEKKSNKKPAEAACPRSGYTVKLTNVTRPSCAERPTRPPVHTRR